MIYFLLSVVIQTECPAQNFSFVIPEVYDKRHTPGLLHQQHSSEDRTRVSQLQHNILDGGYWDQFADKSRQ